VTADIIAAIDEVTAPQCGWCNKPLRADGPSDYFCNEQHQMAWRDGTAAPRPSWIGRALGEPVRVDVQAFDVRTLTWQPPADVVEVRVERPAFDELWRGFELLPVAVGYDRWFLRGADGHEVEVPGEVVANAMPLQLTRRDGLSEQEQIQESLRQCARQFAEAADRIRALRQPVVSLGYVPTGALDWLPGGEP
jgi:hypothetical protein